jgi:hypothetical protein
MFLLNNNEESAEMSFDAPYYAAILLEKMPSLKNINDR